MRKADVMDRWFGEISVASEVVEALYLGMDVDEEELRKEYGDLSNEERARMILDGNADLKGWLDRHYNSEGARKIRGGKGTPPLTSEYSLMVAEPPFTVFRIRIVTYPKKKTTITTIKPGERRIVL